MRSRAFTHAARLAGLCLLALAALPVSAGAATHAPALQETISSGMAGANPDIALTASFGPGAVSIGAATYWVNAGHLTPKAWQTIQGAPAGTRIGTFTSSITGSDPTQIRVQAAGSDAQGAFVRATIGVTRSVAQQLGTSFIPATLRLSSGAKYIAIRVDMHAAVGRLAALKAPATLATATLKLQGTIAYGGAVRPVTLNPVKDTALVNMVSAQACAQPACTTLSATTPSSAALVHLPKQVTLRAPDSLQYGFRYSIQGTARPGDHVMLQVLTDSGTLVESPWTSAARADGQFVVRATIRSGFGSGNELIRPASAHYAVAAREGNATVLAVASNATHVRLAKPTFKLVRKDAGSKLHFAVRVPGADPNVKVRIVLGKRTLAEGMANAAGRVFATIARPIHKGNLRVIASVPGADTSISDPVPFSTL
jgi:hypothetical protein